MLKEKTKLLEEIRESEEKYRNLFKNSMEGIFTVDIEGNITSCNKTMEEILGYTTGELMAFNYRDYMDPETADYIFQRYNELFRTGRPIHDLCYEIIRKNGERRIVEGYVSLIKKGKWIEGFHGSIRDVTEQKEVEKALLESERKYKALFEEAAKTRDFLETILETSLDMVVTLDKKGIITFANRVTLEISGFEGEGLLGRHVSEFYDRGMERAREIGDILARGEKLRNYKVNLINREGKEIPVSISGTLLKNREGEIIGTLGFFRDITPLVAAEEELRTSEKKYRDLLQNSSDMILMMDMEGRYTSFNRAAEERSGYAEGEILGQDSLFLSISDMEKVKAGIRKLLKGERYEPFAVVVNTRKGQLVADLSISLVWEKDRAIGFMGIMRDITDKKRMEEYLKASEKRYRDLVQNSVDMILTMDMQGRYTLFNRAAEEKLGCTEGEILGKDSLFLSRDDIEKTKTGVRKLLKGEQVKPFEVIVNIKEGQIIAEMNISLIWEKDRAVGMMGIVRDITDKKRMEEDLKTFVERYQRLLQNSSDLIYTVDMEGRFTSFNRKGEEITGFAEKDILGKHAPMLVPQDALEKTEAVIKKLLKDEKSEPFEISVHKLGKGSFTGELSLSLIWERERVIGTMGIVRDITEKRRAEEELRKKNEELESFAHSVSHDLKAPVISIQGFSSILLTNYLDKLDEAGKRYLTRIQSNTQKMQAIIADLLEFSKINMVVNNFEDVSSQQIITDVLTVFGPRLKDLKVDIQRKLPAIRVNRTRIYQVFENLIGNSIAYMGDTEDPMIEIGCEPRGEFHEFYVRDNGIGIAPQYHQKIFQIFQRLNDVGVEGTGIGLAIVTRIIESQGGFIRVESEKGKGATFYFTLPGAPDQEGHAPSWPKMIKNNSNYSGRHKGAKA